MAWAYVDKAKIMHIVEAEKTAKEASVNGKIVETEFPHKYGFPVVDDKQIIVYGAEDMKLEANGKIKLEAIPPLAALYKECE